MVGRDVQCPTVCLRRTGRPVGSSQGITQGQLGLRHVRGQFHQPLCAVNCLFQLFQIKLSHREIQPCAGIIRGYSHRLLEKHFGVTVLAVFGCDTCQSPHRFDMLGVTAQNISVYVLRLCAFAIALQTPCITHLLGEGKFIPTLTM